VSILENDEIRAPSPFTPAPKRNFWPLVLVMMTVVMAFAVWFWQQRQGSANKLPDVPLSAFEPSPMPKANLPTAPPDRPTAPLRNPPAAAQTISKCVLKGKTTYSDGPCPEGAKAQHLAVHPDENLMQAPVSASAQPPTNAVATQAPTPVIVQAPQPAVDVLVTCRQLERRIEELDALARQPQLAQTQDWITAEKREARDRQFRLKC